MFPWLFMILVAFCRFLLIWVNGHIFHLLQTGFHRESLLSGLSDGVCGQACCWSTQVGRQWKQDWSLGSLEWVWCLNLWLWPGTWACVAGPGSWAYGGWPSAGVAQKSGFAEANCMLGPWRLFGSLGIRTKSETRSVGAGLVLRWAGSLRPQEHDWSMVL